MVEGRCLTAGEAAAELGVSLPTLYSYVSRGMVRSEAAEGGRRSRRYRAEDVRALKERRRDPEGVAEGALRWGSPVLESGITLVDGGGCSTGGATSRGWRRGAASRRWRP